MIQYPIKWPVQYPSFPFRILPHESTSVVVALISDFWRKRWRVLASWRTGETVLLGSLIYRPDVSDPE